MFLKEKEKLVENLAGGLQAHAPKEGVIDKEQKYFLKNM